MVAAGLLVAGTLPMARLGGFLAAAEFTRASKDSPYLVMGAAILVVAAGMGTVAWLLVARFVAPWWRPAAGVTFVALVVALPGAAGVLTAVEAVGRWYVYPPPSDPSMGAGLGYTLRVPPSWTLFPPLRPDQPPETVTLISWTGFSPAAAVPAGGLKVTLRPAPGELPAGAPFVVGEGRYAGTITVAPPGDGEGAHTVMIVYAAGGRTWEIYGAFAEPPDATNPNTAVFYGIVASLRHGP